MKTENNKLILIAGFLLLFILGFASTEYLIPKFRPFGTSTAFADSTNYVTLNKGFYPSDSVKVGKDLTVGVNGGKILLDTNKNGQLYFTGLSMYISNTKSKGYMYFSTNQAFNFEQDISGSLSDIATLDTNGLTLVSSNYLQFENLSTTQRDALTPAAGMVIYNITTSKLQCYGGGIWNDLY